MPKEADKELEEILKKRKAKISVCGIGGAGGNTMTRLKQVGITGAECVAINTDAQDLLNTMADSKLLIGESITGGLGAGSDPTIGEEAAKEAKDRLKEKVGDSNMVFVTCGLGGGTGTGGAPILAEQAIKSGALTVGVVTIPFTMEGKVREANARQGLESLEKNVNTLVVIPNDKLLEIVPDVGIQTAFKVADEVLVNSVKGITELITKPGLVNLDFADIRSVMEEGGLAMIGIGESDTENRAAEAVTKALSNPLLDVDVEGANGALINVLGGESMSIKESQEVVQSISERLDDAAQITWGAHVDESLGDVLKVMVIMTGVSSPQIFGPAKPYSKERKKEIERTLGIRFV